MLDERKSDIYRLVPQVYLPHTLLFQDSSSEIIEQIEEKFEYPVILKPNIGYKGFLVKKVDSRVQLERALVYFSNKEFLVQEFLSEPKEYSVMYFYVDQNNYGISSLVEKHLPKVTGDGSSSVRSLIENKDNPFLKKKWIIEKNSRILDVVLKKGEELTIDHVGNYSRGSKFENLNHSINDTLIESIHNFFQKVSGMNFCRLDVKAQSFHALQNGEFKLLEINGAKSEPLHIYDTSVSFLKIVYAVHLHWTTLFKIVKKNIKAAKFPSSREGIRSYYSLKKLVN